MIEIKRWDTGATIYTAEHAQDVRQAVEEAVRSGANLYRANLNGASLTGASLYGANLNRANLNRANLNRANLNGANLNRANLDGANLDGASLTGASLDGANLNRANLNGANLNRANLDGASLDGAKILDPSKPAGGAAAWTHPLWATRQDIFSILDQAPGEVDFLHRAMVEGRIDGSVYCEDGCGCLTGTLGIACGLGLGDSITTALEEKRGIVSDSSRPAEQWFIRIARGDKPLPVDARMPSESVFRLSWALAWVKEWSENRTAIGETLVAREEKS